MEQDNELFQREFKGVDKRLTTKTADLEEGIKHTKRELEMLIISNREMLQRQI